MKPKTTKKYLSIFLSLGLIFFCTLFISPVKTHATATLNKTLSLPANMTGLVGWWTMDGKDTVWTSSTAATTVDKSGNGNTGTLTGMTQSIATTPGKIGQGLRFDGVNDHVVIPDSTSIDNANWTVSTWFKVRGSNFPPSNHSVIFERINGLTVEYNTYISAGSNVLTTYAGNSPSSGLTVLLSERWYHLVLYFDGTNLRMYLNGNLEINTTRTIPVSNANIYLGSRNGNQFPFAGDIDDVRIYNRALSAAEITALYNIGTASHFNVTPKNVLTSGLVGHWTFDGKDTVWTSSSAATTLDKSGNNNTGTLTNMTQSTSPVAGKIGQGLKFDGSNDYVLTTTIAGGGTTNTATFSAWVNTKSKSSYDGVIFHRNGGAVRGLLLNDAATSITYCWECTADEYTATTGLTLTDGQWYFVSVVITPTAATVYKIDQSGTLSSWTHTKTHNAYSLNVVYDIGRDNGGRYWDGNIDDVRIYNRSLSQSEIIKLYNMGR